MRIVGGALKGRSIMAPEGRTTRPTSDRARESIFNILEHAAWSNGVEKARVIDLFAGSGAFGLEALSRGAAFALFVETDDAARGAIRENIESFHLFGVTRIHRRDAADLGKKPAGVGAPFTLAFLDPPYRKGLIPRALTCLIEGGWLDPEARIIVECAAGETIDLCGLPVADERIYGAAKTIFLKAA